MLRILPRQASCSKVYAFLDLFSGRHCGLGPSFLSSRGCFSCLPLVLFYRFYKTSLVLSLQSVPGASTLPEVRAKCEIIFCKHALNTFKTFDGVMRSDCPLACCKGCGSEVWNTSRVWKTMEWSLKGNSFDARTLLKAALWLVLHNDLCPPDRLPSRS